MTNPIKLPTVPLDDTLYNAVLVNGLVTAAARVVLEAASRVAEKYFHSTTAGQIRALKFTHHD